VAHIGPESSLQLVSHWIGGLPLVNAILDRLDVAGLLECYVCSTDAREKVAPAATLGALLRNLALAKEAIYAQREWVRRCEPALVGLSPEAAAAMDDDRLGRALDRLYDADRASMLTELVLRTVRAFDVQTDELHNDSTSITFTGRYRRAVGRLVRGKRALRLARGFNKDYRPDLKQLVWQLTISADGAVPVHYRVWDGNVPDVQTHLEVWRDLARILGRSDFLYVADCKLCDRDTLQAIAAAGGRFLTVLPRSRSEDGWFRQWIQSHTPDWQEISRRPHPRYGDALPDVWRAVEAPLPSAEGYRIVWVWNSLRAIEDADTRREQIEQAQANLEALNLRLAGPRCRLRTRTAVEEAVAQALGPYAGRWIHVQIVEETTERYRKVGPGRPGPQSRYVREVRSRWRLRWEVDPATVRADAASDGMFPLLTNDPNLTLAQVLAVYRYQPRLEKRHQQLKTVQQVAPVCLKNEARIEALLFLHFVALLVHALLERAVRQAMRQKGITALAVYPESRPAAAPTAPRILEVFRDLYRHDLYENGVLRHTFEPQINPIQQQVLDLLGIPVAAFYRR
jgi:hypothetical protein